MTDHFTNLDAMWLSQLADSIRDDNLVMDLDAVEARLRLIAQHIQSPDERNAVLSRNQSYAQGVADAEARMRARSNLLPTNPEGEDERGTAIISAINRAVADGKVKRVPLGERALDDQPHHFNAPVRRKAQPKDDLASKLDLSVLDF